MRLCLFKRTRCGEKKKGTNLSLAQKYRGSRGYLQPAFTERKDRLPVPQFSFPKLPVLTHPRVPHRRAGEPSSASLQEPVPSPHLLSTRPWLAPAPREKEMLTFDRKQRRAELQGKLARRKVLPHRLLRRCQVPRYCHSSLSAPDSAAPHRRIRASRPGSQSANHTVRPKGKQPIIVRGQYCTVQWEPAK